MRVSLVIDGDAKGAEKAADKTSAAIGSLGKQTDAISKAIEEGFNKAIGAMDKLGESTNSVGAANDNFKGALLGLVGQFDQIAQKAAGANSAFGQTSAGVANVAKGVAGLSVGAGTIGLISGALGIAVTVGTTFFNLVNAGATQSNKHLEENARLVGVVRDAYRDASKTAEEFYDQSRNVTLLQAQQNLLTLQADLRRIATPLVRGIAEPIAVQPFGGEASIAFDMANADRAAKMDQFREATERLHTSVAMGKPDVVAYREAIAEIGVAAQGSNPEISAQAAALLKNSDEAGNVAVAVAKAEAALAMLNGTATDTQKKLLGISNQASEAGKNVNEFERLLKSIERQSAGYEAQAASAGKSAGEAARMRAQLMLLQAAEQAGIEVTGKYAEKLELTAGKFGTAAQKAAEYSLRASIAFNRDQLGRNSLDASVASQLQGAFGNDADQQSAIANAIRFNEVMRELKNTTLEITQGAFRDFRNELRNGATAWEAFQRAGENAINRLVDKLADRALDNLISGLFGNLMGSASSGGSGNILGSLLGGSGGFRLFDIGGFTGDIPTHAVAGIVHGREFVVNAGATARHLPLLRAINDNRLPGYEAGGYVGAAPFLAALGPAAPLSATATPGGGHVTNLYIQTPNPRSFAEDRATMMRGVNRMIARAARYG